MRNMLANKDREVFGRIYRLCLPVMKKAAFLVLHDISLSEEVVRETLITVARKIDMFHGIGDNESRPLLYVITRNQAISLHRKEQRQQGCLEQWERVEFSDTAQTVIDDIPASEGYRMILEAISSLEDIYKDALLMKYVYGYKTAEIAEMFSVSQKTVESRLYRGRILLEKVLKEEYGYGF